MQPTKREAEAATKLGQAILEFVTAVGEGNDGRRPQRPREEVRVQPQLQPWQQPRPAPVVPEPKEAGLIGLRGAAEYLGVSTRLLHQLTAPRGAIPVVKISHRVMYDMNDLRTAVQRMKITPNSPSTA
ncbi:hypothetical protein PHYC_03356 [Phycisphaerales bacterium]|nr:hypothetical protein PHYC_03356 [Phycisphaerales bacterium]